MKQEKELSRSATIAAKTLFAALSILKDNGKEMAISNLIKRMEEKLEFNDYEKERYEKTGYIRWQSIFHFFSIDVLRAGYIVKKKGMWYITPEGEEALKLGPIGLLTAANKAYREWDASRKTKEVKVTEEVEEKTIGGVEENTFSLEKAEQIALEGLEKYIVSLNPYEFQDLAAALLRGMGYYTPFVAPRGKDGGIDIAAYRDPLGTQSPRIKVQIKHRGASASVQEIRQLMGLLQKEGDVGIFISTGGFTPDAKSTARSSHIHVEFIDLQRFISLWCEFYIKMNDEDKSFLPLIPIYFHAPIS